MIDKIQSLIEDNTSFDVTRSQVIMLLSIIVAIILLIIFFMLGSTGPSKNSDTYIPPPANAPAPVHIQGQ
jgi:uncharacterized membrane protein YvbJ